MPQDSEFTAADARAIATGERLSKEETLAFFESVIRFGAENQRSTEITVALAAGAHTEESITYAVVQLTGRGFDISKVEGLTNPTYVVKF